MIEVDGSLENVVVGETAVSLVDGRKGKLYYRGLSIDKLARWTFAEAAAWVLHGERAQGAHLEAQLAAGAALSERENALVLSYPEGLHPMQVLQSVVVALDETPLFQAYGEAAQGLAIAAKLPTIAATRLAGRPLPNSAEPNYIRRFLAQIGAPADRAVRRAFEVVQILQLEHGLNASTFTAKVIASTMAPVENVLAGAIGALHGRLHGGADQAALEAADAVQDACRAADFVDGCIARKEKVMGMGHREYRALDPRAKHAKELARTLTAGTPHERTFAILAAMERRFSERMAARGKALHANVEFYKGIIYRSLGLPPSYFTCGFAMARVFGYLAHFMESRRNNRLIRPAVRYVGPAPACPNPA